MVAISMERELPVNGLPAWPSLLPAMAACVTHLGGEHFKESLLCLLRQSVGIEQCILFVFTGNDRMESLLVYNARYPKVAGRLASLYAGGLFRQDPNYPLLRQLVGADPGKEGVRLVPMRTEAMSPAYRSHLFALPDLADKVSLLMPANGPVYYLNLYRDLDQGPCTAAELERLEALAPLLASLVRRHYREARPAALPLSPEEAVALGPLSERERQLCLQLLRGHTLKTAAAQLEIALSTAETYRKRAYAKLGVRSKAGLVGLCRKR